MTQKGDGDTVEGKMFLLKSLLSLKKSKLGRLSGNWNPVDLLLEHEQLHEKDD